MKAFNTKALYDALKKIHDLVNSLDENCGVDPIEIRDIAREALAVPPRQCDVYDPDKAAHMMEVQYCGSMPPSHCDGTNCTKCSFKWFTSTAEEEGAGE